MGSSDPGWKTNGQSFFIRVRSVKNTSETAQGIPRAHTLSKCFKLTQNRGERWSSPGSIRGRILIREECPFRIVVNYRMTPERTYPATSSGFQQLQMVFSCYLLVGRFHPSYATSDSFEF